MKYRHAAVLLGAASLLTLAAACGGDDSSSPATTAPGDAATTAAAGGGGSAAGKKITLLQGVKGDEFYVSMECGAKEAAKAAGVSLDVQGPDKFDATLQNPIIDAITSAKPAALLVAPNDVEASAGPLKRAQDAGIKIVLVDTVVNDTSIGVSRIASDNFQGGVAAAEGLAKLIGEKGEVLVVNVKPGISTTDQRQKGFEEGIKKFPNIKYLGTEFSQNEPAKAAEIITAKLASNPNLAGVFAANLFSAQGTATGVKQAGKGSQVKVVGFDAGPAQVDQLKAGDVQALVVQKPYDIGKQGVEQAVAALTGGKVTPEIKTDFVVATKDNLADPAISKFLYKASC